MTTSRTIKIKEQDYITLLQLKEKYLVTTMSDVVTEILKSVTIGNHSVTAGYQSVTVGNQSVTNEIEKIMLVNQFETATIPQIIERLIIIFNELDTEMIEKMRKQLVNL